MYELSENSKQDGKIDAQKMAAQRSSLPAEDSKSGAGDVESRLNRLLQICQAMWCLLKEKQNL